MPDNWPSASTWLKSRIWVAYGVTLPILSQDTWRKPTETWKERWCHMLRKSLTTWRRLKEHSKPTLKMLVTLLITQWSTHGSRLFKSLDARREVTSQLEKGLDGTNHANIERTHMVNMPHLVNGTSTPICSTSTVESQENSSREMAWDTASVPEFQSQSQTLLELQHLSMVNSKEMQDIYYS